MARGRDVGEVRGDEVCRGREMILSVFDLKWTPSLAGSLNLEPHTPRCHRRYDACACAL